MCTLSIDKIRGGYLHSRALSCWEKLTTSPQQNKLISNFVWSQDRGHWRSQEDITTFGKEKKTKNEHVFDKIFRICWISSSILCNYTATHLKTYQTLAYKIEICVFEAAKEKLKINGMKYPVDKVKGCTIKYKELWVYNFEVPNRNYKLKRNQEQPPFCHV